MCFGTSSTSSTAEGTRVFFEWLEKTHGARFGGTSLPMDSYDSKCGIICKDSLELADLKRLFRHETSVLKVRNFFPAEASLELGKTLAREGETSRAQNWKVSTSRGLESSDVVTVGRHAPFNIALANQAQDEYFREVRKEMRDRRGLARIQNENEKETTNTNTNTNKPRLWPLDLLRLELDELWPSGAGLARANHEATNENCMGGGLPRLMVGPTRWKKGLVHVDELAPLDDTKGCFSANVYLQLPYKAVDDGDGRNDRSNKEKREEQPVMEVWPMGIRSKWDWYRVGGNRACAVLSCVFNSFFAVFSSCIGLTCAIIDIQSHRTLRHYRIWRLRIQRDKLFCGRR